MTRHGKTATETSVRPRRDIHALDALRAVSIALVILAHSAWYIPPVLSNSALYQYVVGNGAHGVAVFFVISGFLITLLLLRERERYGVISLKHFYLRRTMRIFPPFYAFILIIGVLWLLRIIPEDPRSFLSAATYTWCFYPKAHGYFITHTWSLSIEEQFYLLWPLTVTVASRRNALRAAGALILCMPFLRLAEHFLLPQFRGHEFFMIQGWVDTIMVGCALALVKDDSRFIRWREKYVNGWTALAAAVAGLYLVPAITAHLPRDSKGFFSLVCGPTITAFGIGIALCYFIETRNRLVLRVVQNRAIRHIGVISYSLYLWQQLFVSERIPLLPLGYLFALLAAETSYWVVERPSLRLRAKLEQRVAR